MGRGFGGVKRWREKQGGSLKRARVLFCVPSLSAGTFGGWRGNVLRNQSGKGQCEASGSKGQRRGRRVECLAVDECSSCKGA